MEERLGISKLTQRSSIIDGEHALETDGHLGRDGQSTNIATEERARGRGKPGSLSDLDSSKQLLTHRGFGSACGLRKCLGSLTGRLTVGVGPSKTPNRHPPHDSSPVAVSRHCIADDMCQPSSSPTDIFGHTDLVAII